MAGYEGVWIGRMVEDLLCTFPGCPPSHSQSTSSRSSLSRMALLTTPLPGAAFITKLTLPKKMYQFDWIVGASPALLMVNSAPFDVYFTSPAVTFQFSSSAPVVKSWV